MASTDAWLVILCQLISYSVSRTPHDVLADAMWFLSVCDASQLTSYKNHFKASVRMELEACCSQAVRL